MAALICADVHIYKYLLFRWICLVLSKDEKMLFYVTAVG